MTEVYILFGSRVDTPIILDDCSTLNPYRDILPLLSRMPRLPGQNIPNDPDANGCALFVKTRVETYVQTEAEHYEEQMFGAVCRDGVARIELGVLPLLITLACQKPLHPIARTSLTDQKVVDTLPIVSDDPDRSWWSFTHLYTSPLPIPNTIEYIDVSDIGYLVECYSQFDTRTLYRLRISLNRFRSALTRTDHDDQCIDLAIALEAILIDSRRKITKRLASRSAWLYADNKTEMCRIRKLMEDFYKYRCEIVHGKKVSKRPELIKDAVSVFVVCIRRILALEEYLIGAKVFSIGLGNLCRIASQIFLQSTM